MFDTIAQTVSQEFSDLPDLEQATRIVVRLVLAAILGGLLGFERESKGKAAGVRTHMLVAMGAALFVIVPQQFGIAPADMSRVIQGVVAGIGFLCAGTILKGDREETVKGLTTAAGLWMTCAIGMAAGLGKEATAVLSTFLALAILALVPLTTKWFDKDGDGLNDAEQAEAKKGGGGPRKLQAEEQSNQEQAASSG
ncbi:MAG: MgtC/SapB family protein [Burkholderiaceae bacterium]